MINTKMEQLLLRCKQSSMFFIENFCKVKHPKAGIIPFNLFKYQRNSILDFKKHRFCVYKKTRQCGASTLAGAFALWYAMFYTHKTVLIVSKRDIDSIAFLDKNMKFVYKHLPIEFHRIYGDPTGEISAPPPTYNEHTIVFPNGSLIRSLTSSKETLRSNSSSLNIIDEAAFMPDMEDMWSAGYSTMMHGGSVICVSTTNGQGNWYNVTWEGAINKENDFHPIEINWWDMDWVIEYKDEFTGEKRRLCPIDGIRKCETREDKEKWGPYYSPWLEDQYRSLQQRGEAHLFRQEVLAEFIGTGNTVLSRDSLLTIQSGIRDDYKVVGTVPYTHPVDGRELTLDFENQLWIWKPPVRPTPPVVENGRIIKQGAPGHFYGIGIDVASGEDRDYSAIEVVDYTSMEQVAELFIKVPPAVLIMMSDYLGRWYNNAYLIPERTGIGNPVSQGLYDETAYSNIYRLRLPGGKLSKKVGFPTSPVHKPILIKCLTDYLEDIEKSDEIEEKLGVKIHSRRLYHQASIFVHLGSKKVGNVKGPGNHDDLIIAFALALIGVNESAISDQRYLFPTRQITDQVEDPSLIAKPEDIKQMMQQGGMGCLVPIVIGSNTEEVMTPIQEFQKYITKLGGIPQDRSGPAFGASQRRKITKLFPK